MAIESNSTNRFTISEKMNLKDNDNFVSYEKDSDGKALLKGSGVKIGANLFVKDIIKTAIGDFRKCVTSTDELSLGTLHICHRTTAEFIAALKNDQRELSKLRKELEGRTRSAAYGDQDNTVMKKLKPNFDKNMANVTAWYTGIQTVNNKLGSLL
jgi:hypothetical protein